MGAVSVLVGARATDSSLVAMPSTGVHQGWLVKSQLLYQLSYAGAPHIVFIQSSMVCHREPPRAIGVVVKLLSGLESQPNLYCAFSLPHTLLFRAGVGTGARS